MIKEREARVTCLCVQILHPDNQLTVGYNAKMCRMAQVEVSDTLLCDAIVSAVRTWLFKSPLAYGSSVLWL
jgi:hypothetical protein